MWSAPCAQLDWDQAGAHSVGALGIQPDCHSHPLYGLSSLRMLADGMGMAERQRIQNDGIAFLHFSDYDAYNNE